MISIKVKAMVNTAGLRAGDQVEIEYTPLVAELLKMGYLVKLRLRDGRHLPE